MDVTGAAPGVLVVEDDEALAGYLDDNLSADGFRVSCARGAGEGLRALEARRPDLLVLDLMLADASGLAVLDRVRASDGLASRIDPALPVMILSGRGSEADRVRGFARGADDYVVKPCDSMFPAVSSGIRLIAIRIGMPNSSHVLILASGRIA